jgi:signal transduction histidine kinase
MRAFRSLTVSRRPLVLFALMVLLPVVIFTVLIARAVRNDRVQAAASETQRQRQVARLFEREFSSWIFSPEPDGAVARAAFRFRLDGNQILIPEFQLALPVVAQVPRPRTDALPPDGVTAQVITEFYYPRILVLLRDFKSGAQYFLRLRSLIVLLPGSIDGYAIDVPQIVTRADAWLAELCAGTSFKGSLRIGDLQDRPVAAAAGPFGVAGFPFFQIVFERDGAAAAGNFGQHAFAYSMSFLFVLTSIGSFVVYRAMSHDVRLSELRSDFVSAVSHEFRSPLSSMLVLLERLDATRVRDPEKLAEYHAVIRRDAQRLAALVSRLLDFAQIENGKQHYALARADLVAIARDAVDASRHLSREDRLKLLDAGGEPLWILGERAALQDCIQNLIENAVKYSAPGQPIEVTCWSTTNAHVVAVRDRGVGIPPAEQEHIFEKFFRGRHATEMNVPGIGIGLALVKHVIESHGGSVTVDSEPGAGSRFLLHLPKAAD